MRYIKITIKEDLYLAWRDHMTEAEYRFLRVYRNILDSYGDLKGPRVYFKEISNDIEELPDELPLMRTQTYYTNDDGRVELETIRKSLFDISYGEKQVVTNGLRYM